MSLERRKKWIFVVRRELGERLFLRLALAVVACGGTSVGRGALLVEEETREAGGGRLGSR